ncbi:MAG: addiction module protein [Verrucomicrobia bacterium]|nr:addiction module protein [Verrucomicrobiota bacterium]
MSKAEILQELPALAPVDRQEIREKLDELDAIAGIEWLDDCDLTEEEKQLLEQRLAAIEKDPHAGSSWEEVEARIHAKRSDGAWKERL